VACRAWPATALRFTGSTCAPTTRRHSTTRNPDRRARRDTLHTFFQSLRTPYREDQAEVPEDLAAEGGGGRPANSRIPAGIHGGSTTQDYSRRFVRGGGYLLSTALLGRRLR